MTNFAQKCYIAKDFNTKAPKIIIRTSNEGKDRLVGTLTWKDGKKEDDRTNYTNFAFSTLSPEIIALIQANPDRLFEIKGWLKNKNWKDELGKWQGFKEIYVVSAEIVVKDEVDKKSLNGHIEEGDEIPF